MRKLYKANQLSFHEMASRVVVEKKILEQKAVISFVFFTTSDQDTVMLTIANYCKLQ